MTSRANNSSYSRRTLFQGLIGLFLIGVSSAYFLHRYPLMIPAVADEEVSARFVLRDDGAQVVLLVDTARIAESWSHGLLSDADFSYGWVNTLEQEFGYFDVLDVSGVGSSTLVDSRIVVVSSSAVDGLLAGFGGGGNIWSIIEGGAVVVFDSPSDEALALLGLIAEEQEDGRSKLSAGELKIIVDDLDINLSFDSLPLFSPYHVYSSDPSHTNLVNDVCFDYARVGAGAFVLTKWDFGRWVTLTQQGLPDENLQALNRYADLGHTSRLEANDLVADSLYLNSVYPWVDIFEKRICNIVAGLGEAPRWHTAPSNSSGIFMMTHDDEGIGDAGSWMNVYENQRGFNSTSFLMRSDKLSSVGVGSVLDNGGEIGLHWNRFERKDKAALEEIGIGRWRPLLRRRNLASQAAWLDSLGVTPKYNRNHYFLWDEDPYKPFRALNALGFTMDFSYGPDLFDKGYIFGCSFPFSPLDVNGASFELVELPVSWAENFGSADSAWIDGLISENAERYHGVVNPLYHNNTFAWAPDYSIYESWRSAYELAKGSGHAFFTAGDLERFLEARRESEIRWESDSEGVEIYCDVMDSSLALIVSAYAFDRPSVVTHDSKALSQISSVEIDSVRILDALHWRIVMPVGKYLLSADHVVGKHVIEESVVEEGDGVK